MLSMLPLTIFHGGRDVLSVGEEQRANVSTLAKRVSTLAKRINPCSPCLVTLRVHSVVEWI